MSLFRWGFVCSRLLAAVMSTIEKLRLYSRIKPPMYMYVRRSTMYEKAAFLFAGTGVRKISSVAYGFSSIKIHYSVNTINEVYVYSIKYCYSNIILGKP